MDKAEPVVVDDDDGVEVVIGMFGAVEGHVGDGEEEKQGNLEVL